jgi:hypothetical protein
MLELGWAWKEMVVSFFMVSQIFPECCGKPRKNTISIANFVPEIRI